MTIEKIKELKRDIVVYKMESAGVELENTFSNSYVIETLSFDNDAILYTCDTYMNDGESDAYCAVILYNDVNEFLKTSYSDIIKRINEANYYNTIEKEC